MVVCIHTFLRRRRYRPERPILLSEGKRLRLKRLPRRWILRLRPLQSKMTSRKLSPLMIHGGFLPFLHLSWSFRYSSIFTSTNCRFLFIVNSIISIFQEPVASPILAKTMAEDKTDNLSTDIVLSPQWQAMF